MGSLHQDVFLNTIVFLSDQYGVFGTTIGYLVFLSPVVSVLLEVSTLLSKITETKYDDLLFRKLSYYWDMYVDPALCLIPRVNIPVAAWIVVIVNLSRKLANVIQRHKRSELDKEKNEENSPDTPAK